MVALSVKVGYLPTQLSASTANTFGITDAASYVYTAASSFPPNASTTGVPSGTTLTPSGGFRTTSNNQVINALAISGGPLYIDHTGVTVTNCSFSNPGTSSYCIDIGTTLNNASVTISHCTFDCGGSDAGAIRNQSTGGSSWTGSYLNIFNGENGVRLGGNATIQDSWIHDLTSHNTNTGPSGPHFDCVECYEGANNKVLRNMLDMSTQTETSCVNFQGDFATVTSSQIIGNRMLGGGWIMNLRGSPPGAHPVDGVVVNNNQLGASGLGYGAVDATNVTFSGNTDYRTGANIDTQI